MSRKSEQIRKRKQKNAIYIGITAVCVIILLVSAGIMLNQKYQQKKAEEAFEKLAETATEKTGQPVDKENEVMPETEEKDVLEELGIEVPEKNLDFAALQEENPDIYAWVYVPGTQTDYPVLRHPEDDAYYLDHNLDGSSGLPGCIYTESVNSLDFTDPNTVLYGHNMKNGSMFGSLHNFEDRAVFDENQYIYIYTPEKTLVYQIFAAYEFSAIHLIYNFDLSNPEIFQNYLDQIFTTRDMSANIREGITVNADNHIITLSTCVTGEKNKRFLVQGVLLNEP